MARVIDNNLSGTVGNLVFYTVDGINYVRSKPGKQTRRRGKKTNPNTSIFGKVSTNGSRMLRILGPNLLFPLPLAAYNNTRGWMRNQYAANGQLPVWDISARPNDMCQLNPAADLRDMLFTAIQVSDTGAGKLLVSIPAMNPRRDMKKLPIQVTGVTIKLAVLHSTFTDSPHVRLALEQYHFDYTNTVLPAKDIIIDTGAAPGNIAMAVLVIEPAANGKSFPAAWLPAAIIAMGRTRP